MKISLNMQHRIGRLPLRTLPIRTSRYSAFDERNHRLRLDKIADRMTDAADAGSDRTLFFNPLNHVTDRRGFCLSGLTFAFTATPTMAKQAQRASLSHVRRSTNNCRRQQRPNHETLHQIPFTRRPLTAGRFPRLTLSQAGRMIVPGDKFGPGRVWEPLPSSARRRA